MAPQTFLASLVLVLTLSPALRATSAVVGTCVDFESGSLPSFMLVDITDAPPAQGRVEVSKAYPFGGIAALDLDTNCNACGGNTRQAVILTADLAGESHPVLRFWVHEHGDENHVEDGVFVSDDSGLTFALILSFNGFPSSYELVSLDLEVAVAATGMSLVDGFLIKFQSLDNSSIPTDGYSFDNICLEEPLFMDGFETGDASAWQ